jgi:hypothetical protein
MVSQLRQMAMMPITAAAIRPAGNVRRPARLVSAVVTSAITLPGPAMAAMAMPRLPNVSANDSTPPATVCSDDGMRANRSSTGISACAFRLFRRVVT